MVVSNRLNYMYTKEIEATQISWNKIINIFHQKWIIFPFVPFLTDNFDNGSDKQFWNVPIPTGETLIETCLMLTVTQGECNSTY